MNQFYEELCNMFIRPTRQKYNLHDLGNPIFGNYGRRRDFEVSTHHNLRLKCSFFQAINLKSNTCIIYLHSFNGSRLESLRYCNMLLERGYNFCSFDFAGSGISEGEFVSLGYHQRQDLFEVIKYIGVFFGVWNFMLWGRSMGAGTIIKFCEYLDQLRNEKVQKDIFRIKIRCAVLDSPFSSLNQLAIEIAQNRITLPEIFLQAVFLIIKAAIEKKADFKVCQLQLLKYLHLINFPVLIVASRDDTLVKAKHSENIYNGLKIRDKEMIFIKGEHHDVRDAQILNKIFSFFDKIKSFDDQIRGSLLRDAQERNSQKVDRKLEVKSHSRGKFSQLKTFQRKSQGVQICLQNKLGTKISKEIQRIPYFKNSESNQSIEMTRSSQFKPAIYMEPKNSLAINWSKFSGSPNLKGQNIRIFSDKEIAMEGPTFCYIRKPQQLKNNPIFYQPKKESNVILKSVIRLQSDDKEQQIKFTEETVKKHHQINHQKLSPSIKKSDHQQCWTVRHKFFQNNDEDHCNIINSKLKKRKKELNQHNFYISTPLHQHRREQENIFVQREYVNSKNNFNPKDKTQRQELNFYVLNNQSNQDFPQNFVVSPRQNVQKVPFNAFEDKKVSIPQSKFPKAVSQIHVNHHKSSLESHNNQKVRKPQKFTSRFHTVNCIEYSDDEQFQKTLIKNKCGVSLKNLAYDMQTNLIKEKVFRPQNQNQLKKSEKCIILKSPKKKARQINCTNTTN